MPAPMPSRATITQSLVFGMIAIPLEIYAATEESAVRRSQYVRGTDHPVGRRAYDKVTDETVEMSQVGTYVTASDGSLVEITDDEITAAVANAEDFDPDSIRLIGFVPMIHLYDGTYSVERTYYARPARVKSGRTKIPNKAAAKTFNLLLAGMADAGSIALVQFATRGKPRYGALTSTGDFMALRYDEEVRTELPMPEAPPFSKTEVAMVGRLIEEATLAEPPVFTDKVAAYVAEYADAKAAAGENFTPVAAPKSAVDVSGDDLDLTALLEAALSASKAA